MLCKKSTKMFSFSVYDKLRLLATSVHLTPSFTQFFAFIIKRKRQLAESLKNEEYAGYSCYSSSFIIIKTFLYTYLGIGLIRTTYLAFLIERSPDKSLIREHLHFDPILCFYILKLNTFGDPLAVIAISLLPLYCISIDYILTIRFSLMPMDVFNTVQSFLVYDRRPTLKRGSLHNGTQQVQQIAAQLMKRQTLSLDSKHLADVVYFDESTTNRVALLYPALNSMGIAVHFVFGITF